MTSKIRQAAARASESEVYAWAFPAGESAPALCGRFRHAKNAAGQGVGSFVYGARYLKQAGAVALDPVLLPLRSVQFQSTANDGVFGVLADATPDDWGRYVIDRRHGTQAFPIGYWLHSQEDRVGNLCFSRSPDEAPNLAPPTSRALVDEAWIAISGIEAGRPLPPELEEKIRINTAMGGARPKPTVADASHQWLAKFPSSKDDPALPVARIEAAMLDLAGLCKINVAHAQLHETPATAAQPGGVVPSLLTHLHVPRRFFRAQKPAGYWRPTEFLDGKQSRLERRPTAPAS